MVVEVVEEVDSIEDCEPEISGTIKLYKFILSKVEGRSCTLRIFIFLEHEVHKALFSCQAALSGQTPSCALWFAVFCVLLA